MWLNWFELERTQATPALMDEGYVYLSLYLSSTLYKWEWFPRSNFIWLQVFEFFESIWVILMRVLLWMCDVTSQWASKSERDGLLSTECSVIDRPEMEKLPWWQEQHNHLEISEANSNVTFTPASSKTSSMINILICVFVSLASTFHYIFIQMIILCMCTGLTIFENVL